MPIFDLIAAVSIEGVPGIVEKFLQFCLSHLFGLVDNLVGGVIDPVIVQNPLLEIFLGS